MPDTGIFADTTNVSIDPAMLAAARYDQACLAWHADPSDDVPDPLVESWGEAYRILRNATPTTIEEQFKRCCASSIGLTTMMKKKSPKHGGVQQNS
jgi:hypothetical protein